jgi:hypothetical protein
VKRFFVFLTLVFQVFLSLSPFTSFGKENIWAVQTSVNGFASTLATYVGIQFICLSMIVLLMLFDFNDRTNKKIADFGTMLKQYTPLTVRGLRENEFYKEFLGYSLKANHFVNICYFAPRPPQEGAPKERNVYYKKIIQVMKDNPHTQFRRIIRDTPANRDWTRQLARDLIATTNCSIRMLQDLDEGSVMPLALSVQIVDGTVAWLVAVAEHSGAPMHRDIAIENSEVVRSLNKYFNRLWDLSRPVFEPGFDAAQSDNAIDGDQ